MRTGEVAVVTPFRYSRLLFALVFAVAWFGERLDAWTIVGMVLIVVTGVFALLPGRGNSPVERPASGAASLPPTRHPGARNDKPH